MKKIFFSGIIALSLLNACAQKTAEKDVPQKVVQTFKTTYPKADEVSWTKENPNFEASFELNEVETSVVFDANGAILETEQEIESDQLPASIVSYMATTVKKKIKEAAIITKASGEKQYEAEAGGKDYLFTNDGKFIKIIKD